MRRDFIIVLLLCRYFNALIKSNDDKPNENERNNKTCYLFARKNDQTATMRFFGHSVRCMECTIRDIQIDGYLLFDHI